MSDSVLYRLQATRHGAYVKFPAQTLDYSSSGKTRRLDDVCRRRPEPLGALLTTRSGSGELHTMLKQAQAVQRLYSRYWVCPKARRLRQRNKLLKKRFFFLFFFIKHVFLRVFR